MASRVMPRTVAMLAALAMVAAIGGFMPVSLSRGIPVLAASVAMADDATPTADASSQDAASEDGEAQMTITDSITDTENLLGGDAAAVSDAINKTKAETGVSVRLIYLPNFMEGVDPEQWASQVLESTSPEPNTVMLAVATQDGNLVVAVSSNSDEWLKKTETVNELSEAAVGPILANPSDPDWPGSANEMMEAIKKAKTTSTSSTATAIGVWAFAGGLVVLAVVGVAFFVIRRRHGSRHGSKHAGGRSRGHANARSGKRRGASHAHDAGGKRATALRTDTVSSIESIEVSDDIQKTSSEGVHSGNHEQAN